MADSGKFGNADDTLLTCARCEAAISDAIDDLLPAEQKAAMELHLATCAQCSKLYAEAQRGQAWLDVLKTSRPEPPASLAMRIINQTSGVGMVPALAGDASVLPMRLAPARRVVPGWSVIRNVLYQPRLAMTAAMAFFSVCLTVNLTGVKLSDVHVADLRPSHLQQTFYQAEAGGIRYYDNLRVVNDFESSVQQIRSTLLPAPAGQNSTDPNAPDKSAPQQNDPNGSSKRDVPTTMHVALAAKYEFAAKQSGPKRV